MLATKDAAIELVPYSEMWPGLYKTEAGLLSAALGSWLVAGLEHIGSTAVPGLTAKPIIDIMGAVKDLERSRAAIAAAEKMGYLYYPYKADQMHWFCKPSAQFRTHHLHLVPYESALWRERLDLRDALRIDPALRARYADLKRDLAETYRDDREAYTEGKSEFIQATLRSLRGDRGSSA